MDRNKRSTFSEKLLSLLCREEYLEEILGDLGEYREELSARPKWQRKVLYWFHVLNFLKPWSLKTIEGSQKLNQYGMFKNYFKTSLRSLRNNALFSTINVAGLAISMSVGVLMILLIEEVSSFDDFHSNRENIYRVTSTQIQGNQGVTVRQATGSYFMADLLSSQFSGVEDVLVMSNSPVKLDLGTEEKAVPINCHYAGESFFDIFSFQMIKGNQETALSQPGQVVLTATAAKKLFGDADPIGQLITAEMSSYLQNGQLAQSDLEKGIVSGVVEDPPVNSHLRFEALISLKTLELSIQQQGLSHKTNPGYVSNLLVYLLLSGDADPLIIEESMAAFLEGFNSERLDNPLVHNLQSMKDFVTSDTYHSTGPTFSRSKVLVMIGLTAIVLLSACFNYTNLSLARALRRTKEVGVRKVVGASRSQVFSQFIVEAVVLSLLALIVGVFLFVFIRPQFLALPDPSARGFEMFELSIDYWHIFYFVLFAIVIGVVAGVLPAAFHSKLKAGNAFKSEGMPKGFLGAQLRKILVVFQFTLSIGLIMCAVLINDQYQYTLDYDLGYETDDILTVDIHGEYANVLANEFGTLPEVSQVSKSSWVLGVGGDGLNAGMIFTEGMSNRALSLINYIDQNYIGMHQIEIVAGTHFEAPLSLGSSPSSIIVNEAMLRELELGNPEEALGKRLIYNGMNVSIQGVFKEAVSIGLTKKFIESMAFIQTNRESDYKVLNLKVRSEDIVSTLTKLEEIHARQDAVNPFTAAYYEDKISESYKYERSNYSVISFLAAIAISISTMGLLGMAVFTTETRMKEIGIRKVLGASAKNLAILLSKGFFPLMIIAAILAIPTTLWIVENEVLNTFWERAPVNLFELLSGFLAVLIIGLLTIGWQVRQAARTNPIDSLRSE
ncbi:FtsX-like permease family protein [Roseivirga sp. E12]|uniref:FtsX-like permease family protein n=1 Tax=Roseivirga sp. E12 TaxID=2819237 RepID=UPI001ABD0863|nr:FtsX-like permease family protein [Roseivirga sp. E12]MBO3698234.1 ABC transporter permease [Roseivirga sp. E12]